MTDTTGNARRIRSFVADLRIDVKQHVDDDDQILDTLADLKLLTLESRQALRETVLVAYEEGISMVDIADALGCKKQVVWKMLRKAPSGRVDPDQLTIDG